MRLPRRGTGSSGMIERPQQAASPQHCVTCSDRAIRAEVLELLTPDTARVSIEGAIQQINVALVDAAPGDIVFVHADVAIAKLQGGNDATHG